MIIINRQFSGLYAIVLTPFKSDGSVDFSALEKYLDCAVHSKSLKGLVMCGSTSEFTRMTFEENMDVIKIAKSVNGGVKQLVCGITAGDTYTSLKYASDVQKLGADAFLLAPSYYFKLSDSEIYENYKTILTEYSDIPFIGYNIPQCTNAVSLSVFEKLLEFENLKGFKNSWNDMQEITAGISLRNKKREDVSMFTGLDACLYGTLALGGDGIFSAITYLMPEIIDFIYANFGKNDLSFECQCDLIELINSVNQFTFPLGYRVLSDALGMYLGEGRESIPQSIKNMADTAKNEMKKIYRNLISKYAIEK